MRKAFVTHAAIGAMAVLAWSLWGTVSPSQAATVNFISTDEPGPWFKCVGAGCVLAGTQSLAVIGKGDTVQIDNGQGIANTGTDTTNTVHTFTSLLYPTNAKNMPFDQPEGAFRGTRSVTLK